jgi:hypothetical protein
MKYILFIFIIAVGMIACSKSNNLSTSNNGSKLTAISSDSAGAWKFGYMGDLITSLRPDTDLNQYGASANIQYMTTDSIKYVMVNFFPDPSNYTIIYSLTSSNLPLQIDKSNNIGGTEHKYNIAKFSYLANTDLLDSVLFNHYNDTIIFKCAYTGENITAITETEVSNNKNSIISSFNFSYVATPNIFRDADPLLYIYEYPQTALWAQSMVVAVFFSETFSASTFNIVTTSGITNGAWNQDSIRSKMTYSLNANGKITKEAFDNEIFEGLAGKRYSYQ